MSYPAPIAAALSETSIRQLAYWRSSARGGPLLRSEHATGDRVLYSFRDVVALRTVAYLREDVSLQRIRRAVETLRNLGSREHLSRYRLVADGGSVVWVTEADAENPAAGVDLVLRPGQEVLVRARGRPVPVPFDLVAGLVAGGVPVERVGDYYSGVGAAAAKQAAEYAAYVDQVAHRQAA